jgi:hypothetical protein
MKVLVACEYSGTVRDAFCARGHDAMSCDLLPTEGDPRWHYEGDVFDIIKRRLGFDDRSSALHISFSVSAFALRNKLVAGAMTEDALDFVRCCWTRRSRASRWKIRSAAFLARIRKADSNDSTVAVRSW